jgi:maltokinase
LTDEPLSEEAGAGRAGTRDLERPPGWPTGLEAMIPAYLGAQRWYAGESPPEPDTVEFQRITLLWSDAPGDGSGGAEGRREPPEGSHRRMWQVIVSVGPDSYQLLLGERPAGEPAEYLHGHESAVAGATGNAYFYDATLDSEMAKALLGVASRGALNAVRSRPLSAEQSNTSLVFDDEVILKVFRRLRPGPNPDVEVTTALSHAGFQNVAEPLVRWSDGRYDLGFGQRFLAGGVEGWALAITSLRDLYSSGSPNSPADAGGDFAAEAQRLGRVTAEMHMALASLFPPEHGKVALEAWASLVDSLRSRLAEAADFTGLDLVEAGEMLLRRLEEVTDPGPVYRVHGDFHLGQVMRTDAGWFVLDFEGEPAKPVEERTAPTSPLKDVTSMLRSFHYASQYALVERAFPDWSDLVPLARAWESHNRQAFLDGYQSHPEIVAVLPQPGVAPAVMTAFELDKALYELAYERAHRPEWVPIPVDAIERLVTGEST